MSRYAILHTIERLDPEKDQQRIILIEHLGPPGTS
jgi:hypothetical protein